VFYNPNNEQPDYIGSVWRWHSKSDMQALSPIGPFETSKEFFTTALNEVWDPDRDYEAENKTRDVALLRGVRKILNTFIDSAPFTPTPTSHSEDGEIQTPKQESFVLRHDDLDLQKILVSPSGHVTGIIDWDSCTSVPECIGYTSLPTFLRRDFLPEYSMARSPHMTWAFEHYREVYAEAMEEYVGGEAKLTRKSAIYQMVLAGLEKDVDCRDVVEMLLREIPEFPRVNVEDLLGRVGLGWPDAERKLREKIGELLVPE
jgi:hypothetical protein